jgi:CRP-like cAMP-binding protein
LGVLLTGISTYATLLGNLSAMISKLNARQEDFRDRLTSASLLMDAFNLPEDIQHRVKSCIQYQFEPSMLDAAAAAASSSSSSASPEVDPADGGEAAASRARAGQHWEALSSLPAYLRNEVLVYINGEIVHKVPLFRGCSDGFIRSLVPVLRNEIILPGDYLIRANEIGREMYLIRHGLLEVIAHGVVVATLNDGSYVGEVAVMFEQKRTASVRAVTFCDILVLSKDDFDGVLSQYPDVKRSIAMQAKMRRNARSMQDKELRVQQQQRQQQAAAAGTSATPSLSRRLLKTPRGSSGGGGASFATDESGPGAGGGASMRISITPVPPRPTPRSSARGLQLNGSATPRAMVPATPSRSSRTALSSPSLRGVSRSSPSTAAAMRLNLNSLGPSPETSAAGTLRSAAGESDSYQRSSRLPVGNNVTASSVARSSSTSTAAVDEPNAGGPRAPSKWKKLRMLTRGQ